MKLQTTFSTEVFSVRRLSESVKMDQGVRKRLSDSCESLGAAVDCTSKEGRKVRKTSGADPRFLYLFLASPPGAPHHQVCMGSINHIDITLLLHTIPLTVFRSTTSSRSIAKPCQHLFFLLLFIKNRFFEIFIFKRRDRYLYGIYKNSTLAFSYRMFRYAEFSYGQVRLYPAV